MNSVCRGKEPMREITSGFQYIRSLRLFIKYTTCSSTILVILHKCVIWLPFIMGNCGMLQWCHRQYFYGLTIWLKYLEKLQKHLYTHGCFG